MLRSNSVCLVFCCSSVPPPLALRVISSSCTEAFSSPHYYNAQNVSTMEEITPVYDDEQPENLLFALCHPTGSDPPLPVPSTPPSLPAEYHPAHPIRAPLPRPSLVTAVHNWLVTRSTTPEDIPSAEAFVKSADLKDTGAIRSRLKLLLSTLRLLGLPEEERPTEADLRYSRNHPRVYAALAFIARTVDPDGWNAALQDAGANHPSNWRDAMMDEPWAGDHTAREILRAFGNCTIVVAGSQGSGKSATVGTLLNRPSLPQSHAFTYHTREENMTEAEKNKVKKLRHLAHVNWPDLPIERNLIRGSHAVERCHVKIDGQVLSFVELPSLESFMEGTDEIGGRIDIQYGTFESVVKDLQGERPNLVLLVERLDDVDERRLRKVLGFAQRMFGRAVYSRMIVVLTHGESLPGAKSYSVWAFEQTRRVEAVLRRFTRELKPVPVVVVENSRNCCTESDRRVLPDGTDFVQQFLRELKNIAEGAQEGTELRPLPTQRWWEKYVLILLFSFIVSRIR